MSLPYEYSSDAEREAEEEETEELIVCDRLSTPSPIPSSDDKSVATPKTDRSSDPDFVLSEGEKSEARSRSNSTSSCSSLTSTSSCPLPSPPLSNQEQQNILNQVDSGIVNSEAKLNEAYKFLESIDSDFNFTTLQNREGSAVLATRPETTKSQSTCIVRSSSNKKSAHTMSDSEPGKFLK